MDSQLSCGLGSAITRSLAGYPKVKQRNESLAAAALEGSWRDLRSRANKDEDGGDL